MVVVVLVVLLDIPIREYPEAMLLRRIPRHSNECHRWYRPWVSFVVDDPIRETRHIHREVVCTRREENYHGRRHDYHGHRKSRNIAWVFRDRFCDCARARPCFDFDSYHCAVVADGRHLTNTIKTWFGYDVEAVMKAYETDLLGRKLSSSSDMIMMTAWRSRGIEPKERKEPNETTTTT